MNQKQAERAKWVRDDMDARAAVNGNTIETAIQNERITELDHRCAAMWRIISRQAKRIEKLETALRDMAHCLIGGSVDVDRDAETPGTMFHSHHILGVGSAMTMAEIYHRLEK